MHATATPPQVRPFVHIVLTACVGVITALSLVAAVYNSPFFSPHSATAVGVSDTVQVTVTEVEFKAGCHARRQSNCDRWDVRGQAQHGVTERSLIATHCTHRLDQPDPGDRFEALVAPYGSQALLTQAHTQTMLNTIATLGLSAGTLVLGGAGVWVLGVMVAGAITTRMGARPTPPGAFAKVYAALQRW